MSSITKRGVGFTELLVVSVVFAILVLLGYELLPAGDAEWFSYICWLLSLIAGYLLIKWGFDYYRIRYSFSLTFLVVVFFLYNLIVLLTSAPGLLRALAVFTSPYLGIYLFGSLSEMIRERRKRAEIIATRAPEGFSLVTRIRSVMYQLDATIWAFMIFGFAYLTVFMLVPILFVLAQSFTPPVGGAWWSNFYNVLRTKQYVNFEPLVREFALREELPGGICIVKIIGVSYGPVLNSLIIATIVTITATLLGIIVAYVLARYVFPGRTLLRIMSIVPLFNTPFINAYVVKLLWSEAGPISQLYKLLTGCYLKVDGLAGVAIAQIFTFFPIVYLNAYTAFLNVDPSTEEQAENLGAKGFRLFRSVTLPLALPGIVAGSILVFVFSLEDLGAPVVFNEQRLISYVIFNGIITAHGTISPEIAALGIILLLIAVVSFLAIRSYVSMRTYAMISRGGRWNPRIHKPGILGYLAIYLGIFPLVIFAMLPQIGVILISLNILQPYFKGYSLVFSQPTIEYITQLLSDPQFYKYIVNTLIYAGVSIVIAVFLAISVAYSVSRLKIKHIPQVLDALATSPLAIPGLVMALGYYLFFLWLSGILPPEIGNYIDPALPRSFQAWLVFIIAFSVRRLPYVVRSVFAGFQQVHEALEESAMNLGASRYKVIFGVILPYIIGYILSGALLGFIYMATEVSTSVTFGGINSDQAPLTFAMKDTLYGAGGKGPFLVASMGTLLILVQLVIVIIIVYVFKQRYAFIGV